tara:strand:- start:2824 stop:3300 length:477 start_codon:yes stop_codon:yes gene_type:complete
MKTETIITQAEIKTLLDNTDNELLNDSFKGEDQNETLEMYLSEEKIGYGNFIKYEDGNLIIESEADIETTLKTLGDISNLIFWAYNQFGCETKHTTEADKIWEDLNLGGDDDVDYNATYLDIPLYIIEEHLKLNIELTNLDNKPEERKAIIESFNNLK